MPELQTPDGEAVELAEAQRAETNARFDAAMNDDAPEPAAPPRKAPAAPAPADKPRARRGRPPKDERPRTTPKPAAAALGDDDRRAGVTGLVQVSAGIAMIAAKGTGNMAFAADAVTLVSHGDKLADACVQTARNSPAFAAALDRVCAAGPYAALIGASVAVVSQLARNHKPGLEIPGTVHPDALLAVPAQAPAAAA